MEIFAIALAVGFGMYALWARSREKSAPPEGPPYITVQDIEIMSKAGITGRQWQAMTPAQRADLRWRIGRMD